MERLGAKLHRPDREAATARRSVSLVESVDGVELDW